MKNSLFTSALMLASMGLLGCSQLWGGSTKPDSENCVVNPDACATGQFCNTVTEACEGVSPPDLSTPIMLPTPPTSFILPGGLITTQDFPRDATYSIAAQGDATIYYTLDGSPPQPGGGSTYSGRSPLSLGVIPAGTQLHWSADYGAGYGLEPPHSFSTSSTNPSPSNFGFIPDPAVFDLNGGPLVIVAPGTHLTGNLHFQAWQSIPTGYCPGCIIQYVVAVQSIGAVGCLNTVSFYGYYPGQSDTVPFAFDAPMTPGVYRIYSGLTLEFSCDGSVGGGPDVGEIIVQ